MGGGQGIYINLEGTFKIFEGNSTNQREKKIFLTWNLAKCHNVFHIIFLISYLKILFVSALTLLTRVLLEVNCQEHTFNQTVNIYQSFDPFPSEIMGGLGLFT